MRNKLLAGLKIFGVTAVMLFGLISIIGTGGGGGGGGVAKPDTTVAAGEWHGTLTDARNTTFDIGGIISTDGQFRFLISEGNCFGTQYKGTFTSMDGNTGSGDVTGYLAEGCDLDGQTVINGTFEITVAEDGSSLSGTYESAEDSGTFSLEYDPSAETPVSLAQLAGEWQGDLSALTVSANGSFTGTVDADCNLSGNISVIDPDGAIFNITGTVSGCDDAGNYSGLGLAYLDGENAYLYIFVSSSSAAFFDEYVRVPDDGGGGGLSYTGITTQAQITLENAVSFAVGAWLSGSPGISIDVYGAVQAGTASPKSSFSLGAMPGIFDDIVSQIKIPASGTPSYLGAIENIVLDPIYGTCGGVANGFGTVDDATGAADVTVSFQNYCEDGFTINGTANLTGTVDLMTEELLQYEMSFDSLTLTTPDESITIMGTFSADYTVTPIQVGMSYLLKDNIENKTYWFRDVQVLALGGDIYSDITGISGQYYDPAYGYVNMSIGETIRWYDADSFPASGSLIATGTAGTKSRLTFVDATHYMVDADTDNDGGYDDYSTGPTLWSETGTQEACVDVSGVWLLSVNNVTSSCGDESGWSSTVTIEQTGCVLSTRGIKETDFNVPGTVILNSVTIGPGNFPEDAGTTTATYYLTVGTDGMSMTGNEVWTWTWPEGDTCTDGSADLYATRVSR